MKRESLTIGLAYLDLHQPSKSERSSLGAGQSKRAFWRTSGQSFSIKFACFRISGEGWTATGGPYLTVPISAPRRGSMTRFLPGAHRLRVGGRG